MSVLTTSSGSTTVVNNVVYSNGFTSRPLITLANVEQAINLPAGTRAFLLKNVGNVILRLAYSSGGTTTNYITLSPASYKWMTGLDGSARTLYVRSSDSPHQLELEYWT